MKRYLHGGVNITGFQLLDLESRQLQDFMQEWQEADLSSSIYGEIPDILTVGIIKLESKLSSP